jgi:hypothetical protein
LEDGKVKKWEGGDNRVFDYSSIKQIIENNDYKSEGKLKIGLNNSQDAIYEFTGNNNLMPPLRLVCKWKQ